MRIGSLPCLVHKTRGHGRCGRICVAYQVRRQEGSSRMRLGSVAARYMENGNRRVRPGLYCVPGRDTDERNPVSIAYRAHREQKHREQCGLVILPTGFYMEHGTKADASRFPLPTRYMENAKITPFFGVGTTVGFFQAQETGTAEALAGEGSYYLRLLVPVAGTPSAGRACTETAWAGVLAFEIRVRDSMETFFSSKAKKRSGMWFGSLQRWSFFFIEGKKKKWHVVRFVAKMVLRLGRLRLLQRKVRNFAFFFLFFLLS